MQAVQRQTDQVFLPALEHAIKLPVFEGPLDLLLYLIRQNELDIYDIPIESVTRQYLDVLYAMEKLNLEVAGEFFVMAATLMYIKSRMLLPKSEQVAQADTEEEEADPRWELVQQLLEYKKLKESASKIKELIALQQDVIPRSYHPEDEEPETRALKPTDRIELWNTFNLVLRRLSERLAHGSIKGEQITVADRMEFLLKKIETEDSFTFSSLIPQEASISFLVATFLAILELTRLRRLDLRQDDVFAEIYCQRHDEPLEATTVQTESKALN